VRYFNNDKILATICQNNTKIKTKTNIESFPENWEWDFLVAYFCKRNLENIITTSNLSIYSLKLVPAFGLFCLINRGGINHDH